MQLYSLKSLGGDTFTRNVADGILLGTFYVRKSDQESVSTQQIQENFNGNKPNFEFISSLYMQMRLYR